MAFNRCVPIHTTSKWLWNQIELHIHSWPWQWSQWFADGFRVAAKGSLLLNVVIRRNGETLRRWGPLEDHQITEGLRWLTLLGLWNLLRASCDKHKVDPNLPSDLVFLWCDPLPRTLPLFGHEPPWDHQSQVQADMILFNSQNQGSKKLLFFLKVTISEMSWSAGKQAKNNVVICAASACCLMLLSFNFSVKRGWVVGLIL